jgi:hypothetical protein
LRTEGRREIINNLCVPLRFSASLCVLISPPTNTHTARHSPNLVPGAALSYNTGMFNRNLATQSEDWPAQIAELREQLAQRRPRLVDAEAELTEELAVISAFEFELKRHITPFTRQLDKLELEINQLRKKLRMRGDWADDEMLDARDAAAWAHEQTIHESTDYKYRPQTKDQQKKELGEEARRELKRVYRQLARRFHPDMGVDDDDRAYRTEMMMTINTAYALGDLKKLQELADAPDAAVRDEALTDEMLVVALRKELAHVENRLREIQRELQLLQNHRSHKLRRQKEAAAADGRDWFAEITAQLRESIARRRVERDILHQQLEMQDEFGDSASTEEFADLVWDATLEQVYEEDISPEEDRWIQRRRDRVYFEEDFDDDMGYQ